MCSFHQCYHENSNNDCLLGVLNPFTAASHAQSMAFAYGVEDEQNNPSWGIVAGGGNGELSMQDIHPSYIPKTFFTITNDGDTVTMMPLFKDNTVQQIKPRHQGPLLSIAA